MYVLLQNGYYADYYSDTVFEATKVHQSVITADTVPTEQDNFARMAYKWVNGAWVYDEARYTDLAWVPMYLDAALIQSNVEYVSVMTGLEIVETSYVNRPPSNYRRALFNYNYKYWTDTMMNNLMTKGYLTNAEYSTVTGMDYVSA